MALQLRCGGVFLSQLSDSNNKNGRLVIGGVGWGREPFLGRLRCSSNNNNSNCDAKKGVPDSNYVVPLEKSFSPSNSSCITRPLIEILRDLNKRIPHNIIKSPPNSSTFLPWYHANRMLSFYAPGWCGEVRDVIFANNGTITVVYRLTIRGSDGELLRLKKIGRRILIFHSCLLTNTVLMYSNFHRKYSTNG
ncbi:hypothetical protein E1A91_D06G145400v1 [Gossypium mustelinum]|uniref:Uncharacterized protein n=1 Tax=Gossypium mustelinum TaxID=34275 RepID=A0A5D2UJ06_GOSMU|nr:hypothetical protein E1A91_D06G145400v1 [Gossypium mustelinum]